MPALRLRERLPSAFDCQRMFGKVDLVEDPGGRAGKSLGSDPLDVDADSILPTRTNYRTPSCSLRGTREKGVRRATVKPGRSKPQDGPTTALSTEGEVTRKWPEKRNGRSSKNDL